MHVVILQLASDWTVHLIQMSNQFGTHSAKFGWQEIVKIENRKS